MGKGKQLQLPGSGSRSHPSPPSSDLTFPFATGRRPLQAQVANAQVVYLATLGSTLQPQPQRRRRRNQQRLIFAPRARTLLHICSRATEGKTSMHGGLLEKSCQGCRQLLRGVLDPDTFLIGLAMGISVINIGRLIETNNALQM